MTNCRDRPGQSADQSGNLDSTLQSNSMDTRSIVPAVDDPHAFSTRGNASPNTGAWTSHHPDMTMAPQFLAHSRVNLPHQSPYPVQGLMNAFEDLRQKELELQHQLQYLQQSQLNDATYTAAQHVSQPYPHQLASPVPFSTHDNHTALAIQQQSISAREDSTDDSTRSRHIQSQSTDDLENRLRGMILKNAGQEPVSFPADGNNPAKRSGAADALPPHMQMASPEDQMAYLTQRNQRAAQRSSRDVASVSTKDSSSPRKKMNQAERRRMSSQLNVPVAPVQAPKQFPSNGESRASARQRGGFSQAHADHRHSWSSNRAIDLGDPISRSSNTPRHGQPPNQHRGGGKSGQRDNEGLYSRPVPQDRNLFQPERHVTGRSSGHFRSFGLQQPNWQTIEQQSAYLDSIAQIEVAAATLDPQELDRKEKFRMSLEQACRRAIAKHEDQAGRSGFDTNTIELKCFGSLSSGFATNSSDMDLALVSQTLDPPPCSALSPVPRLLEKVFLEMGFGARLLTRTRVPIIKLCEKPSEDLMRALKQEQKRWEDGLVPLDSDAEDPGEAVGGTVQPGNGTIEGLVQRDDVQSLSQYPDEDLRKFYGRVKLLLADLGGEDVGQKTGGQGNRLLSQISRAFVNGLHDESLKRRLQGYRSMDFDADTRSLAGVWYQAEGERIVMSWESRPTEEATLEKERQGEMIVKEWRELQDKVKPDIVSYNRSLHRHWDRLKTLPSATLGILAERHDDTSETYYTRSVAILKDLGGRDIALDAAPLSAREHRVLHLLIERYVGGIRDGDVRRRVHGYVSSQQHPSFAAVYGQHHAERQIHTCLGYKGSAQITEQQRALVQQYADLIRQGGPNSVSPKVAKDFQRLVQSSRRAARPPRERHADHLEFPKSGIGIQCDVNFSNHLALYNTHLLRCYAHCDARVRPMVLFVKAWAKRRRINSPYHGTLSSYGYVLMVLHFLANIADPPVVPNLQLTMHPSIEMTVQHETNVDGYDVRFWRDEDEIRNLAQRGMLTQNKQSLGFLLRGFLDYYAGQGPHVTSHGFSWAQDALSLRTKGGLLSKRVKGWTGAKTTVTEATRPGQQKKEVRHRYLFAIEDPFELDHNVARTVTHPGIVAIRDEFRRAWQIISQTGTAKAVGQEDLFQPVVDPMEMAQKVLEGILSGTAR